MQINQQQQLSAKEQLNQKPANFTESKKEYQVVFKLTYLTASIFSAVLLRKVYMFQTMSQFDNARQGTMLDLLLYSLPFGALFTAFDLGVHYMFDGLCEKYYLSNKYEGKARAKRAYTLVKWGYSLVYYLISSIAAIYILKDTSYFPTWLGGNGSCSNQYVNAPLLSEANYTMKIFYLLQFGKHASRLFSHMFIRQEGNYYQYVLHHALSTFLILFSYLTNQWLVGIMVLLCHDASDFFLILGRGYRDYKNYSKKILQSIYLTAVSVWILGRLVIFPACCVYNTVFTPYDALQKMSQVQRDVLQLPYQWMGFMLVGLLFLQLFWTYYIGKAFISVTVSEKIATNTYQ